jgi:ketosteroid isomerase-like protein
MKRIAHHLVSLLVIIALFYSCFPKKLTQEDIAKEKKAIESVAVNYSKLIAAKNTDAVLALFSNSQEFMGLGTDSAEVFKNKAQLKSHLEVDWQLLDVTKVGDLQNLSILISKDGGLASMLYEVPWDMNLDGQTAHALVRFAMTMVKENNEWHIIQLLGQMATVGQSSEDMLEQMKKVKK